MEHVESICSSDFKLFFITICSIRTFSVIFKIFSKLDNILNKFLQQWRLRRTSWFHTNTARPCRRGFAFRSNWLHVLDWYHYTRMIMNMEIENFLLVSYLLTWTLIQNKLFWYWVNYVITKITQMCKLPKLPTTFKPRNYTSAFISLHSFFC